MDGRILSSGRAYNPVFEYVPPGKLFFMSELIKLSLVMIRFPFYLFSVVVVMNCMNPVVVNNNNNNNSRACKNVKNVKLRNHVFVYFT
jgi:hypothetical protein